MNKIILVGTLAADPEVRVDKHGMSMATFPLATKRDFTSDNKPKLVTDFHRVVAWGNLAKECGDHLEKGKAVYVEGILLNRAYETNGERRYVTEIRAESIHALSIRKSGGQDDVQFEPVSCIPPRA